jgi:AcrR family transcriptional regulator
VSQAPAVSRQPVGLRERKKAKTRAMIQHHALRLFAKQGYDATTVEQIADAAEISPSTFFRYFPNKEDVVLTDEYDPLIIEALRSQPPDVGPIEAIRGAMRSVFGNLSPAEIQEMRHRSEMMVTIPDLRAAFLGSMSDQLRLIAMVIAPRVGHEADDFAVRTFAGALFGVAIAALFDWLEHPDQDLFALMDDALAHLDAGLPFNAKG